MQIVSQAWLQATEREVTPVTRDGEPTRAVALGREFDSDIGDLWDAVTNPIRLRRWFLPIEGEFRLGGRYQLVGNAGGLITACKTPHLLHVTWEFGGDASLVELHLVSKSTKSTRLELRHICNVNEHWFKFGPAAVGIGWECGILALTQHLADPVAQIDQTALSTSAEANALYRGSSLAWCDADIAGGENVQQAHAASRRTFEFYTGMT